MTEDALFGIFMVCGLGFAVFVLMAGVMRDDSDFDPPPAPAPKPEPVETYGHPIDIVGEIRKGLPTLQHGHLWEWFVEADAKGRWVFTLHLLDVSQNNTPIGMWRVNLSNGNLPYPSVYPSWTETYGGGMDNKGLARRHLVNPAIVWAKQMHAQIYQQGVREYGTQL